MTILQSTNNLEIGKYFECLINDFGTPINKIKTKILVVRHASREEFILELKSHDLDESQIFSDKFYAVLTD